MANRTPWGITPLDGSRVTGVRYDRFFDLVAASRELGQAHIIPGPVGCWPDVHDIV